MALTISGKCRSGHAGSSRHVLELIGLCMQEGQLLAQRLASCQACGRATQMRQRTPSLMPHLKARERQMRLGSCTMKVGIPC